MIFWVVQFIEFIGLIELTELAELFESTIQPINLLNYHQLLCPLPLPIPVLKSQIRIPSYPSPFTQCPMLHLSAFPIPTSPFVTRHSSIQCSLSRSAPCSLPYAIPLPFFFHYAQYPVPSTQYPIPNSITFPLCPRHP